jgi:hypothetical protein
MRFILLSLVLLAALIGLTPASANAATAAAGLHVASGSAITQVYYRWNGRRYNHRRYYGHRWHYY